MRHKNNSKSSGTTRSSAFARCCPPPWMHMSKQRTGSPKVFGHPLTLLCLALFAGRPNGIRAGRLLRTPVTRTMCTHYRVVVPILNSFYIALTKATWRPFEDAPDMPRKGGSKVQRAYRRQFPKAYNVQGSLRQSKGGLADSYEDRTANAPQDPSCG